MFLFQVNTYRIRWVNCFPARYSKYFKWLPEVEWMMTVERKRILLKYNGRNKEPCFCSFRLWFRLLSCYVPTQRSLLHSTTDHWFAKLGTFELSQFYRKTQQPFLDNQNGSSWVENADPIGARRSHDVWCHDPTRYQWSKRRFQNFWHPGLFSSETSISQKATSASIVKRWVSHMILLVRMKMPIYSRV